METERSIVLQKKTILFLSLIIISLFGIIYVRGINNTNNETDIIEVAVNVYEEESETVKENIKYLAPKVIFEDELVSGDINFEVETFAGDVTSLVENIENESVADSEIQNDVTNNESTLDILNDTKNEIIEEKKEFVEQSEVTKEKEDEKINQVEKEKVKVEEIKTEKTKTVTYKSLAEDNPPTEYAKVVEAKATAYCLCKKCCGKTPDNPYYGYTHSGIKIVPGTGMKVIAVDPNVIPLNSKVYVEGLYGAWDYGYAIAADTGSAIKDLKIDLYMDTHEEALQWGRKNVKVYVLGE